MNFELWFRALGNDMVAVGISVTLVALYYLWLRTKVRHDPNFSIHGVNQLTRAMWIEHVMRNPSRDVMAVQTLRNFIMGASLMASTATLLIIGTLTLSGQADSISRSWHTLNVGGTYAAELWVVKVLCLLVDFIMAFFAFVMSVRLANQVIFMITMPISDAHPSLAPEAIAKRFNRAGSLFAIGMRAFFYAIPLVFWLFGPVFLVLATAGLVLTLQRLDRSEPAQD